MKFKGRLISVCALLSVFSLGFMTVRSLGNTALGCVATTSPVGGTHSSTNENEADVSSVNSLSFRQLDVRVLLGTTFCDDYSSAESYAEELMSLVGSPFVLQWSLLLNSSFVYVSPLPIDLCELHPHSLPCVDSVCGSNCTDSLSNNVHHKNAGKNFNRVVNDISIAGYDLMVTLVSGNLCGINENGVHITGYLGLGSCPGDYVIGTVGPDIDPIVRVRIIQHELSHCFGCYDNGGGNTCTPGVSCIMNGGLDDVNVFELNIWCPSCQADFNPALH